MSKFFLKKLLNWLEFKMVSWLRLHQSLETEFVEYVDASVFLGQCNFFDHYLNNPLKDPLKNSFDWILYRSRSHLIF